MLWRGDSLLSPVLLCPLVVPTMRNDAFLVLGESFSRASSKISMPADTSSRSSTPALLPSTTPRALALSGAIPSFHDRQEEQRFLFLTVSLAWLHRWHFQADAPVVDCVIGILFSVRFWPPLGQTNVDWGIESFGSSSSSRDYSNLHAGPLVSLRKGARA